MRFDGTVKKRAVRVAHAGTSAKSLGRAHVRERGGRSPVAAFVGLLLVLAIGAAAYGKWGGHFARPGAWDAAAETPSVQTSSDEAPMPVNFRCDGRTHCSQMSSCAEATYFLRNCPAVKMDGDGNGVPCEQQWCKSGFVR